MSDDYELKFKTTKEGQGAEKLAEEVKQVTRATHESAGAHEETSKHAEKSVASHRSLHSAVHQLSHEFPLFALALRAMTSPYTVLIAVTSAAVAGLNKLVDQQNEVAESGRNLSASYDPVITKTVTHKTHLAEAAVAANQHALALKAVGEEATSAKTKVDQFNVSLQLQVETSKELWNIEKDRRILAIQASDLSAEAKAEAIAKIGRQADVGQDAVDQQARQLKAAVLLRAKMGAHQDADEAAQRLPEEEAKLTAMKDAAKARDAQRKVAGNKIDDLQHEFRSMQPIGLTEYWLHGASDVYRHGRTPKKVKAEIEDAKRQQDALDAQKLLDDIPITNQENEIERLRGFTKKRTDFDRPFDEANAAIKAGEEIEAARKGKEKFTKDAADAEYKRSLTERVAHGLDDGTVTRGVDNPAYRSSGKQLEPDNIGDRLRAHSEIPHRYFSGQNITTLASNQGDDAFYAQLNAAVKGIQEALRAAGERRAASMLDAMRKIEASSWLIDSNAREEH
ncbi:MAG: hypothetical protein QOF48_1515 [Verrucomicrobiota bacterium]|jgi:hypothetical protein